MVKRIHGIFLGLLLFALPLLVLPQFAMADATAYLDQQVASFGESITLTIKVEGDADGEPDLSVLQQDFEVLSQSQSSNYSLVNGSFSRSNQWRLALMPKRLGSLQIPPIQVGNMSTQALTLKVLAQQNQASQNKDIFLEMKASSDDVLVQAQVLLTIKLYRAVNTVQPELSEPDVKHAFVERVGEDKNFETVIGQRRYIVTQRQYALFPQQSGALTVPAVQFSGSIVSGRSMFNQSGKVVRISSDPVQINVLPKPATWDNKETWLPAKELSLRELWIDGQSTTYKVGEPLTRTIEMRAKGLTAAQLPTLFTVQDLDGFKQYPDQPVLENSVDIDGIEGVRQEKVALIPTKAGELKLPGITVVWWNTDTQQKQTMIIPARVVDVLPADHAQANMVEPAQPQLDSKLQGELEKQEPQVNILANNQLSQGLLWKWIALLSALGWFLTVGLWWRKSAQQMEAQPEKEKADAPQTSVKEVLVLIKVASEQGDVKEALRLLPKWGQSFYNDASIQVLSQLKGKSEALDEEIQRMERFGYSKDSDVAAWSGKELLAVLQSQTAQKNHQKKTAKLKGLYD